MAFRDNTGTDRFNLDKDGDGKADREITYLLNDRGQQIGHTVDLDMEGQSRC